MHGIARITRYTTLAALGAGMASAPAAAQENTVSVTVYNQNFALVKDVRRLELTQGTQEIRIDDVAAQIEPTSVHFAPLDRPGQVAVLEQNFQYDLAGPDRLLDRYLDRDVTLVQKDGTSRNGRLLSYNGGSLVLAQPGGGAVIVNRGEVRDIAVGELPGGLVTKPTLVWTLASDVSGPERAEVSYLTNGIGWHAEYVAVVNQEDTELSMDGWVSLDNRSGATYPNARLKLVAGDVRRVQDPRMFRRMDAMPMAEASAGAPQFEERDFFEYHIYTLERPATIVDRETKQLSLFPPPTPERPRCWSTTGSAWERRWKCAWSSRTAGTTGWGSRCPRERCGSTRKTRTAPSSSPARIGSTTPPGTRRCALPWAMPST